MLAVVAPGEHQAELVADGEIVGDGIVRVAIHADLGELRALNREAFVDERGVIGQSIAHLQDLAGDGIDRPVVRRASGDGRVARHGIEFGERLSPAGVTIGVDLPVEEFKGVHQLFDVELSPREGLAIERARREAVAAGVHREGAALEEVKAAPGADELAQRSHVAGSRADCLGARCRVDDQPVLALPGLGGSDDSLGEVEVQFAVDAGGLSGHSA